MALVAAAARAPAAAFGYGPKAATCGGGLRKQIQICASNLPVVAFGLRPCLDLRPVVVACGPGLRPRMLPWAAVWGQVFQKQVCFILNLILTGIVHEHVHLTCSPFWPKCGFGCAWANFALLRRAKLK